MAKAKTGPNFSTVMRSIQSAKYHPVYVLHGEEPYFIDSIAEELEKRVLDEGEKSFNFTVFYGKDSKARQIRDTAVRFPMMAPYNLVIVREAQDLEDADLKELAAYAENPVPSTILVICHKYKPAARIFKKTHEDVLVFVSDPVKDYQLDAWIKEMLEQRQLKANEEARAVLAEYIGNDLSAIVKAMEKLELTMDERRTLHVDLIREQIGRSKEYTIFDLQRVLSIRDTARISQIGFYLGQQTKNNPIIMSLAILYTHFNRMYQMHFVQQRPDQDILQALGIGNAFFLKEYRQAVKLYTPSELEYILMTLCEFDLKAKGLGSGGIDDAELYRELIFRILNARELSLKRPVLFHDDIA